MNNRPWLAIGVIATCVLSAGCGAKSSSDTACAETINSATQTGNTVTAKGSFKGGQPLLRLTQGTGDYFATPISNTDDTAMFDITGIPKGAYTATWDISCYDSEDAPFVRPFVPTFTIK
jgi:hypothetical protein